MDLPWSDDAPQLCPRAGQAVKMRIWTLLDDETLDLQGFCLLGGRPRTFLEVGDGAAKRIRTPDPRITNSEIFGASHINQCLANAKRGLSL